MKNLVAFNLFLILIGYALISHTETVFESSEGRISLLELYTSEGCSSCPPADRWLSELKDDKRLWTEFIPVAFHVDYWNYIGWPDRFSSPKYSDRQRRYARGKNIKTVYTPGFLLNGEEWRSFFGLRRLSLDSSTRVGKLTISVNDQQVQAGFLPASSISEGLVLNVAILGCDLVTEVKAGENRGKQLKHNFAVIGYHTTSLTPSTNGFKATTNLPSPSVKAPRMAIAAWVSRINDQTPIQSVGGWLE